MFVVFWLSVLLLPVSIPVIAAGFLWLYHAPHPWSDPRRWVLVPALLASGAMALWIWRMVAESTSSTRAISLIYVPAFSLVAGLAILWLVAPSTALVLDLMPSHRSSRGVFLPSRRREIRIAAILLLVFVISATGITLQVWDFRHAAELDGADPTFRSEVKEAIASEDAWALAGLAENPATPDPALVILSAQSGDAFSRPRRVLGILPWGSSVQEILVERDDLPAEAFRHLASSEDEGVRLSIAYGQHAPDDVLRKLSRSTDFTMLWTLARNEDAPRDVLEKLARHPDDTIRSAAEESLSERGISQAPR